MPSIEYRNPRRVEKDKIVRWAKARVDIEYIDGAGQKQVIHQEFDLEKPNHSQPNSSINIKEKD